MWRGCRPWTQQALSVTPSCSLLSADPLNKNEPEECCDRPAHLKNPYCMEIPIPEDDYFYRLTRVRCMDFVRAFPGVRPGCRLGEDEG